MKWLKELSCCRDKDDVIAPKATINNNTHAINNPLQYQATVSNVNNEKPSVKQSDTENSVSSKTFQSQLSSYTEEQDDTYQEHKLSVSKIIRINKWLDDISLMQTADVKRSEYDAGYLGNVYNIKKYIREHEEQLKKQVEQAKRDAVSVQTPVSWEPDLPKGESPIALSELHRQIQMCRFQYDDDTSVSGDSLTHTDNLQ